MTPDRGAPSGPDPEPTTDPDAIVSRLTTETLGRPLRHFPIALTTESLALAWARRDDAPEGAVVLADRELSPRQRKGPPWTSFPSKGLYFSLVLRPGIPPEGEGLLWLLTSLGAADGVVRAAGIDVDLKWPDDLLVAGRKIGGVKVEAHLEPGAIAIAVLTCRLNLNVAPDDLPADLAEGATSTLIETGEDLPRERVLDGVLGALEDLYDKEVPALQRAYADRCITLGRRIRAELLPRGEIVGTARRIDNFGALRVDTPDGDVPVTVDSLKRLTPA